MSDKYILDRTTMQPVLEPNLDRWMKWFSGGDRIIKQDTIGDTQISTVFLGIDHGMKKLEVFETMIFWNGDHGDTTLVGRCATHKEALKLHEKGIQKVIQTV